MRLCSPSSGIAAAARTVTEAPRVKTTGRGVMTSDTVRRSSASTFWITRASCGWKSPDRRPSLTIASNSSSEMRCSWNSERMTRVASWVRAMSGRKTATSHASGLATNGASVRE